MLTEKWEEKHGNNLPGHALHTKGIPGTSGGNMTLQSPTGLADGDFLARSSTKRNLTDLVASGSMSAYSIPRQSNLQDGISPLGLNSQGNSCAVFANGQRSVEPVSIKHRFENQFHNRNHLSENPFGKGMERTGNASYNPVSQLQPKLPVKMKPVQETHKQTDNVLSQTEAHRSSVESNLQELIKFLATTHGLPLKTPMEMDSSEYLRLSEILQQSSVQPNKLLDALDGKGSSQEEYSGGSMQIGSCSSKSMNGCDGEEAIKVKETTVITSMEKPKLALTEDESSNCSDNQEKIAGHGPNNDQSLGPLKLDEKKLPARIVGENLWDGSLQLSSSVTLSAVAFFKSGEKLLGNNWPEHVEVKGKVRLEAFEKYVHDLPRSRNRGLMVISLCWKEGSSETGLAGMKEVAKGYKKSSRVGFAQLSSSTDLYICPRTDTIITILAKYGFFKGMAVIDDKQDSMIGCVVWRKNRPSNPVGSTSDTKTTPNSSIQQPPAQKEFPPPESNQNVQSAIVPSSANLESSGDSSLRNPVRSDPCNAVKKIRFEDDDLPEYDFGIKTSMSQPVNPVVPKNQEHRSKPTYVVSPERKTCGGPFENSSKRAKLFEQDDDDMPEWCPPVLHYRTPPQITKSDFKKSIPCPPRPPPPPADTRSAFSYPQFRPMCTALRAPPPPAQRGSMSSVGPNSNHALRPNVNPPFPTFRRPRPYK